MAKEQKYNCIQVYIMTTEYGFLFAEFEGKGWTCLQVAHSKKNVKKEIEFVLEHLSKDGIEVVCE